MNLGATWGAGGAGSPARKRAVVVPPTVSQIAEHLRSAAQWISGKYGAQRQAKRLKVAETLSLGEKRFVSILQVDGKQFLIGTTAGSVSVLATLDDDQGFAQVLKAQSAALEAEKQ